MNNRFLFRGKRIDNNEWITGCLAQYPSGKCRIFQTSSNGERAVYKGMFDVNPTTVGQCTGLSAAKSYRGTEPEELLIFEGDVVLNHFNDKGVLVYENCEFVIKWNSMHVNPFLRVWDNMIEITGTVFDESEAKE